MAGEQTQKSDSSAGPFHWSQEPLVFSCWDIHLSVHSKTFKSDQQCNFSVRFGSDASLQHQFVGPDFIAITFLVQTEWADDIVWFLFFPCVFSTHTLFTALMFLPLYISQKKRVHRLVGSDQSCVDSVDLALASLISATVRNQVLTEGR